MITRMNDTTRRMLVEFSSLSLFAFALFLAIPPVSSAAGVHYSFFPGGAFAVVVYGAALLVRRGNYRPSLIGSAFEVAIFAAFVWGLFLRVSMGP
jgi:hypothetical protein